MRLVPSTARSGSAFTLVELVISASLSAMILVAAYACLSAGVASRKTIEPRAEVIQNARVALGMISADLRCACALSKETPFLGSERTIGKRSFGNIDFGTHNFLPRRPREGDFCQSSYFVDEGSEKGTLSLWRRRNPVMSESALDGGKREEIAQGLRFVSFAYYDGTDWYSKWGEEKPGKNGKKDKPVQSPPSGQNSSGKKTGDKKSGDKDTKDDGTGNLDGMPKAVRVTLAFNAEPRQEVGPDAQEDEDETNAPAPMVFQTVVRLELADRIAAGSSGDSGSSGGASPQANSQGSPQGNPQGSSQGGAR